MLQPAEVTVRMLADVIDHATIGLSLHDAHGRCLVINDALAEINGVDAASSIGRTMHEYLPDLADEVQPVLDRVIASGIEERIEVTGTTPAQPGRVRSWSATCQPTELADGTTGVALSVVETTDQREAAAMLALGQTDLRHVFDRIDQGFCICEMICDGDGAAVDYRFVEVNHLFEEMTGLAGALGRTACELVPDLEQHWIDTYARVAFGRETVRFEQGSEAMGRWFDVFATPLDSPGRLAIVFRDETARHQAELALSRSAARFRAMADDLPLMVWLHDADGEQEFVNRTFCEFFGTERDHMVGGNWQPLLHPDDADGYIAAFRDAVAHRAAFHRRARARDAAGSWRWLESWARPRFDTDGEFMGHIGSSADVTDRVRAEAEREESAQFLRRVLDSLFAFVGVLTPDGTLTEANRAPLDAAGLQYDDVIGRAFWDCYWWSYDTTVQTRLAEAVRRAADGEIVRYDERIRVADDGWLWIDFQIVPLRNAGGVITHLIPSGLDVTERVNAEQIRSQLTQTEQRRRARAEILEASASRLAGAISPHEITSSVLEHLKESMGLEVAAFNIVRDDQNEIVAGPGIDESSAQRRDVTVDAELPGPVAISRNARVRLDTIDEIIECFPHVADATSRYVLGSLLALPVRASDGAPLAALVIGSPDDHAFDDDRVALLEEIADQTGQALQRALLHEQVVAAGRREHAIAVRLQKALLPDRLVDDPRVLIAARYEAADAHLDVGGDWYDTHQWPDGQVGILVGDVVGHDLEAAAAMGRLRSATAALAVTLPPEPVALLDALERVALGPGGTDFVTAASVVLDPVLGVVSYATAGHPPPLLVTSHGSRWLDDAAGPPIGMITGHVRRAGTVQLEPGDVVVLYTDGLVEHRSRPIDTGLGMLDDSARRHRMLPLPALLDGVIADMSSAGYLDDIVTVAARWVPSPPAPG